MERASKCTPPSETCVTSGRGGRNRSGTAQSKDCRKGVLDPIGAQDEFAPAGLDGPEFERQGWMNAVQLLAQLPANGLVTGLHREQRAVMGLEPVPEAPLRPLPRERGSQKQARRK